MRWLLALLLAVSLPVSTAGADETLPYCRSSTVESTPLGRLIVDVDAAAATTHRPRRPHPDPRVHVTVAVLFGRAQDFCRQHPRTADPPDMVRLYIAARYNPVVLVDPDSAGLPGFAYEQYASFRDADAAYHGWSAEVGERIGAIAGDANWMYGSKVATEVQLGLDTLALGPDLVLLPEAVAQTPWRAWHGLVESFCGGIELDSKRALLGVAEYEGMLATLASAGLLAHAVSDLTDPVEDDTGPKPIGTPVNALVEELQRSGIKVSPDRVIRIDKTANGKIVWLEEGMSKAQADAVGRKGPSGLAHILEEHGPEFAAKGIPPAEVPDVVMEAVINGKIVGYQGAGTDRPIYEFSYRGRTLRAAVTVSDNGYIVGMNMKPSPP